MNLIYGRFSIFLVLLQLQVFITYAQQKSPLKELWDENNSIDIVHRSFQDSLYSRKALLDSIISGKGISSKIKNQLKQVQVDKISKGNLLSLLSFSEVLPSNISPKPTIKLESVSAATHLINNNYFASLPELRGNIQVAGVPFQFNHVVQYQSVNGWNGIPLRFRFDKKQHLADINEKIERQFNVKRVLEDKINFRKMAENMLEDEIRKVGISPGMFSKLADAGLGLGDLLLLNEQLFENRLKTFQLELLSGDKQVSKQYASDIDSLQSLYRRIHTREKDLFALLETQNSLDKELDQFTKDDKYIRSGSQLIKQTGFQRFFTKLEKFDLGRMGFNGGFNEFIDGFGSGLLMQSAGKLGLGAGIQFPQIRSAFRDGNQLPLFSDLSSINLNVFRLKQNQVGDGNLIGVGFSMERQIPGNQYSPFVIPSNILNIQFKREFSISNTHRLQLIFAKSMRQYLSEETGDGFKTSLSTLTDFFRDTRVGIRYSGNMAKIGLISTAVVEYSGIGFSNSNVLVNRNGRVQYQFNARKTIPYFKYSYIELGWKRIDQDFVTARMHTNRINSKLNLRVNKLIRVLAFVDGGMIRYPGQHKINDVKNLFAQASLMTKGHLGYLPIDHSFSIVLT